MVQQEAIQAGVAQLGGVSNCRCHDLLCCFAHHGRHDGFQLDMQWHSLEYAQPHPGCHQIGCTT